MAGIPKSRGSFYVLSIPELFLLLVYVTVS